MTEVKVIQEKSQKIHTFYFELKHFNAAINLQTTPLEIWQCQLKYIRNLDVHCEVASLSIIADIDASMRSVLEDEAQFELVRFVLI
jgi:hypothetical protein